MDKSLVAKFMMAIKQLSVFLFVGIFLFMGSAFAEIIPPVSDKVQIQTFLSELNNQGVVVSYDPSLKQDEITGQQSDSAFYLKGAVSEWYYLCKADINNDGTEEYVLCSAGGSGGFFDIVAIYRLEDDKWMDIFNEIKLSMRKLIRAAEKGNYDLEEGWSLMQGSLTIEEDGGKVYFTLGKQTRRYDGSGDDFNPSQAFKFLWEGGKLDLVEYTVGKVEG